MKSQIAKVLVGLSMLVVASVTWASSQLDITGVFDKGTAPLYTFSEEEIARSTGVFSVFTDSTIVSLADWNTSTGTPASNPFITFTNPSYTFTLTDASQQLITFSGQEFLLIGGTGTFSPDLGLTTIGFTAQNKINLTEGSFSVTINQVPIPAAGLLFGSALVGFSALARRRAKSRRKSEMQS